MRPTLTSANIVLPSGYWLHQVMNTSAPTTDGIRPVHFSHNVIGAFFHLLNELMAESRFRFLEDRHEVTEHMVAIIMGDLEGNTDDTPREFTVAEIDIIIATIVNLYDDLLLNLDVECLTQGATFNFTRLIGRDILVKYSGYRPVKSAVGKQIGEVYRNKGHYDADTYHERCWI